MDKRRTTSHDDDHGRPSGPRLRLVGGYTDLNSSMTSTPVTPLPSAAAVPVSSGMRPRQSDPNKSIERAMAVLQRRQEEDALRRSRIKRLANPLDRPVNRTPTTFQRSTARAAYAKLATGEEKPGETITGPTDPRWVLAMRTASELEGPILGPEKREKLLRVGKLLGLNPFDCNLIIAIVQDQARRGYDPLHCPAAGEAQLAMVPLPKPADRAKANITQHRMKIITIGVASILIVEFIIMRLLWS